MPAAKRIAFVGSIKWRVKKPFSRADALDLAAARSEVPGADGNTLLLGVSSRGFDDGVPLDVRVSPQDLVSAWRNGSAPAPGG